MVLSTSVLTGAELAVWRALRAEGTRLFPGGFLSSHAEALAIPEAADRLALEQGTRFGVFEDATPAGIAALRRETARRARHRAMIGAFYVTSAAQGGGAADALMHVLLDHAADQGIWQLELFVAAQNPRAIRFYDRHGFRRQGRLPNAIVTPDGTEHHWFCVRDLRRQSVPDQAP